MDKPMSNAERDLRSLLAEHIECEPPCQNECGSCLICRSLDALCLECPGCSEASTSDRSVRHLPPLCKASDKPKDDRTPLAVPEMPTLRDMFAMAALSASGQPLGPNPSDRARYAYAVADAMMVVRAPCDRSGRKD